MCIIKGEKTHSDDKIGLCKDSGRVKRLLYAYIKKVEITYFCKMPLKEKAETSRRLFQLKDSSLLKIYFDSCLSFDFE